MDMEAKDYKNMMNAEIKLYLERLKNEYESKKAKVVNICKEMEEIENEYKKAEEEIRIRKNIMI